MDFLLGKNKKGGKVSVVFSNIKDFEKTTITTKKGTSIDLITFEEDGVEFRYAEGSQGFVDLNGNGPAFAEYEITQDAQAVNDAINSFEDTSYEDKDDDWFDQLAKANANHTRNSGSSGSGGSSSGSYGCGPGRMGGACGGSSPSYSGCGGSRSYGC